MSAHLIGRRTLAAGLSATAVSRAARAQPAPIRIAVLNDQSSVYSASGGVGTVAAVRLAAEDMGYKAGPFQVEVRGYDHQNKTDIGAAIAARAYDEQGIDAIFDIGNSAISLAVQDIARQRGKMLVHVGSAHDSLYGKACSPVGAQWVYDTYSLAKGLTKAIFDQGGTSWFFITADYAFGTAMQGEATKVLTALGGKVVGSVRHPVGTSDFSSYLLQAQASGANTVALANAAGDTVNAAKQAFEFGIGTGKQKLATLIFYLNSVHELGTQAKGIQYLESFYWDRDDASRNFGKRFAELRGAGTMPTHTQAGNYSAALHYLKAVAATGSRDGLTVMRQMKATPVNDAFAHNAVLRADGRLMKDYFLAEAKAPSTPGGWDVLTLKATIPANEVIRPLAEGGCTFLDPA